MQQIKIWNIYGHALFLVYSNHLMMPVKKYSFHLVFNNRALQVASSDIHILSHFQVQRSKSQDCEHRWRDFHRTQIHH